MIRPPDCFTEYQLPFVMSLGPAPVLASGHDVVVDCSPTAASARSELAEVFAYFGRLGRTGAFGSPVVPPRDATLGDVVVTSNGPAVIRACRVDERAIVILANLLFARQALLRLNSVRVAAPSAPHASADFRSLERRTDEYASYPERSERLPFAIEDDDPSGDSRTFTAEFVRPLQQSEEAALIDALEAWAVVVRAGGYAVAPEPPELCYLEPNPPACWQTGFEYSFLKLRADGRSTDGIVNLFEAFHHRICPLARLTVA